MIRTTVQLEGLGIEIYQEGERIGIHANGANVVFPKERAQDVLDAILTVDWSIKRQHDSAAAIQQK